MIMINSIESFSYNCERMGKLNVAISHILNKQLLKTNCSILICHVKITGLIDGKDIDHIM